MRKLVQSFLPLLRPMNCLYRTAPKYHYSNLLNQCKTINVKALTYNNYFEFSKKMVPVPTMGDSITEGTVNEFKKKAGDYVQLDEIVALIETDKVQVEIRSPAAGAITQLFAKQGDTVQVGKQFFEVDTAAPKPAGGAASDAPKKQDKPKEAAAAPKQQAQAPAQKEAPKGDKPKADSKPASAPAPKPGTTMTPQFGTSRTEKREPMSRMRQRIAQRLKDAQNTYALLTTFQEVDMGSVMDLRTKYGKEFQKKHNVKLGFMSFFIKAAVNAIQDQPIVNAVIDGKDIVYRNYIDISVAVATPNGLMVPVLRNCESQSFAELEKNLIVLANKGRENKISLEDMAGGTFTISNGGVFGSLMGTPIINPPQSAILGMHAIINRPVVYQEKIVARPMMYLALTYDHRIVDGREAAIFLKRMQSLIEDPARLALDV